MHRLFVAFVAVLALACVTAHPLMAQVGSTTPSSKYVDLAPGDSATDGTTTVTNTGRSGKVRVYYSGDKESDGGSHQVDDITQVKNRDVATGKAEQFDVDTGGEDTPVENDADDATVNVSGGNATVTQTGDNVTTNVNGDSNTMSADGMGNTIVFDPDGTGNTGNGVDAQSSGDVDLNGSDAVWGGTGDFTTHN